MRLECDKFCSDNKFDFFNKKEEKIQINLFPVLYLLLCFTCCFYLRRKHLKRLFFQLSSSRDTKNVFFCFGIPLFFLTEHSLNLKKTT